MVKSASLWGLLAKHEDSSPSSMYRTWNWRGAIEVLFHPLFRQPSCALTILHQVDTPSGRAALPGM